MAWESREEKREEEEGEEESGFFEGHGVWIGNERWCCVERSKENIKEEGRALELGPMEISLAFSEQ